MISKKSNPFPENFLPGVPQEPKCPKGFRSDSERDPHGIPRGFSWKFLDDRKLSHNKKPSPFETRSYDNQYKPKYMRKQRNVFTKQMYESFLE